MSKYNHFIMGKKLQEQSVGLSDVPSLHPLLKPHQQKCVDFALRTGRSGLFLDTGLGKTFCQLEYLRHAAEASNGKALLLTPLAVAKQIEREAKHWGYNAKVIREQSDATAQINICNYDRLHLIDPSAFGAVSLDECFAKGTLIDTPNGKKHIENVQVGEYILNCTGADRVSDVHRREVKYAVLVKVAGTSFIASPNHPIFTQRGWVGAQHLRPDDYALATGAAMRLVRGGFQSKILKSIQAKILREVLFSEMAHDTERSVSACSQSGGGSQAWQKEKRVAALGSASSISRARENNQTEPSHEARGKGQDFSYIASNESRTLRAWGKWSRDDIAASINDGCTWERLDSGISVITGPKEARIPNLLQDGLRKSESENRNRGGWSIASREAVGAGQKERCDAAFTRVEGIEILESGDNRLEQLRSEDGKLYFYDLGATRHPSYSVEGILVHNSSILKSFTGKTTRALIDAFADVRFKMAATATPAPNDHMELGQHAEFLQLMSAQEMLMRWFINDTATASQEWRLKGHAVNDFYDWMASWSRMASSPADMGCDATGYDLLPLNVINHRAKSSDVIVGDGLFVTQVSATNMHNLKRQTTGNRSDLAADIALSDNSPCIIWCDTDYEADALLDKIGKQAVEVRGSQKPETKEANLEAFSLGHVPYIITKPSVAGFGLNWQHCNRMIFAGRSFSYEMFYQAVRRCWRFGQTKTVDVHLIVAEGEDAIGRVIDRKADDHKTMKQAMTAAMARAMEKAAVVKKSYEPNHNGRMPTWMR